jgi:hypothetical protein
LPTTSPKSKRLPYLHLPEADDTITAGAQRFRSLPANSHHVLGGKGQTTLIQSKEVLLIENKE